MTHTKTHTTHTYLLEAQEADDTEAHRRVEAQSSLVGAERRRVLDAETAVHTEAALVVSPGNAEGDGALRLEQALSRVSQ